MNEQESLRGTIDRQAGIIDSQAAEVLDLKNRLELLTAEKEENEQVILNSWGECKRKLDILEQRLAFLCHEKATEIRLVLERNAREIIDYQNSNKYPIAVNTALFREVERLQQLSKDLGECFPKPTVNTEG